MLTWCDPSDPTPASATTYYADLRRHMTLQDVLEKHGVGGGAAANFGYEVQKETNGGVFVSNEKAAELDELMAEEANARAVLESITAAVKRGRGWLWSVSTEKKGRKVEGGVSYLVGHGVCLSHLIS